MSLTFSKPMKGVVHVHACSQYDLTSSFVRLQEFYESPYNEVRGSYGPNSQGWTLPTLAACYEADGKPFDYFSKWNGMNVPGHTVMDFFASFTDLSAPEQALNRVLWQAFRTGTAPQWFYLIGTWKDDDVTHELAHAMFYLNSAYSRAMFDLVQGLKITQFNTVYEPMRAWLLHRGYSEKVMDDEMQAYLATSDMKYLQSKLGDIDGGFIFQRAAPFRARFKEYSGGMEPI